MKKCSKCEKEKPNDEFFKGRKDGFSAACKTCHGKKFKKCEECGFEFWGQNSKKYCSDLCRKKNRPQTYKICEKCLVRFGPVDHLRRKYCSKRCSDVAKKTGKKIIRKTKPEARRAQGLLKYHVDKGNITRSSMCEECGCDNKKIEGAHYNYSEPLNVRWLCRSCHVKWDKLEPKGATYVVQEYTKKDAILEETGEKYNALSQNKTKG